MTPMRDLACAVLVTARAASALMAQGSPAGGRVLDAVSARPVAGAVVTIPGTPLSATSGADGAFRFEAVAAGIWRFQAAAIGYRPLVLPDVVVAPGRRPDVVLRLEPLPIELAGIVIEPEYFARPPSAATSTQSLSNEEIRRLPGGLEDVARAVAAQPGVVQVSDGRNDLIVRGGAPSENLYLIDGIEVDNINHFGTQGATGGPLSFVNLDFVRDVTFSTGGFGARYGDRLSSVLGIDLRDGRSDRLGGRATLASSQFGLDLEGPTGGAGSFLLSVRRSYLDFVFKAADFGFVPEYWDILGRWTYRPTAIDELGFFAIGALDNVDFFNDTEDQRYDNAQVLGNAQNRYVAGLSWRRVLGRGLLDVRVGRNFADYTFQQSDTLLQQIFGSSSRESETALRTDLGWMFGGGWDLHVGLQGKLATVRGTAEFPAGFDTDFGDTVPVGTSAEWDRRFTKVAGYAELAQDLTGRLQVAAGVRLDAFPALASPVAWGPRLALAYDVGLRTTLALSGGIYRQAPAYVWVAANPVNEQLRHIRTDQAVLGIEHRPRADLRVRLEVYGKRYDHYAASTFRRYLVMANTGAGFGGADEDEFAAFGFDPLVSEGSGVAVGGELLVQKRMSEIPLYGTLALAIGQARYTALDSVERDGSYERRANLTLSGGYRFNPRWEASLKFRLGTGLPYTPYGPDGTRDPAAYNAERLPVTHALDVRVDRRWNFRAWNLVIYLDVLNVYNRKNVTGIRWDARTSAAEFDTSLGILPTLGVSAEF
jgi:hypothetical protein